MTIHMELWIIKQGMHMDRRNHVTDTKLLENTISRNQVATREPSSTTRTSMVSMLTCITAMETIILEVVMEGMGVAMEEGAVTEGMGVAMEEAAVTEVMGVAMEEAAVTEGMGVDTVEAAATEEVVEDMAATAVILSMTTAINAHVVCLADVHLSRHLMELLSFYLTQTHSKNFKLNFL